MRFGSKTFARGLGVILVLQFCIPEMKGNELGPENGVDDAILHFLSTLPGDAIMEVVFCCLMNPEVSTFYEFILSQEHKDLMQKLQAEYDMEQIKLFFNENGERNVNIIKILEKILPMWKDMAEKNVKGNAEGSLFNTSRCYCDGLADLNRQIMKVIPKYTIELLSMFHYVTNFDYRSFYIKLKSPELKALRDNLSQNSVYKQLVSRYDELNYPYQIALSNWIDIITFKSP